MKNIYLAINNQQSGPFDPETIKQMLSTGQADANAMGWMEGMDGWKALNSDEFAFLGIQSASPVTDASPPSSLPQKSSDVSPAQDRVEANSNGDSGTFAIGSAISEAFQFFKANIIASISWLILAIIIGCIPIAQLIVPLLGVNFFTSVKNFQESGKKMAIGDLFDFSRALDKIVGPIVIGTLIGIGYFLLIIPGLILTFMWMFAPCIQGDRPDLGFVEAMKVSSRTTKGKWLKLLVLIIALALLNLLGALLLGLGLLVTIPVTHVALYTAYAQCKNS